MRPLRDMPRMMIGPSQPTSVGLGSLGSRVITTRNLFQAVAWPLTRKFSSRCPEPDDLADLGVGHPRDVGSRRAAARRPSTVDVEVSEVHRPLGARATPKNGDGAAVEYATPLDSRVPRNPAGRYQLDGVVVRRLGNRGADRTSPSRRPVPAAAPDNPSRTEADGTAVNTGTVETASKR